MSPFRSNYLRYDEITKIVHDWARANPGLVRVKSIGKSVEGRELWLLEIGKEPGVFSRFLRVLGSILLLIEGGRDDVLLAL